MNRKNILSLLLYTSLAANLMVLLTWIITNTLGYDQISSTYLFRNIIAGITITGVSTIFGWFYSRITQKLIYSSLHFLSVAATFVILGIWAHWFPAEGKIIITSVFIFIFLFLIIWISHYLYWRNQIKIINNKLG